MVVTTTKLLAKTLTIVALVCSLRGFWPALLFGILHLISLVFPSRYQCVTGDAINNSNKLPLIAAACQLLYAISIEVKARRHAPSAEETWTDQIRVSQVSAFFWILVCLFCSEMAETRTASTKGQECRDDGTNKFLLVQDHGQPRTQLKQPLTSVSTETTLQPSAQNQTGDATQPNTTSSLLSSVTGASRGYPSPASTLFLPTISNSSGTLVSAIPPIVSNAANAATLVGVQNLIPPAVVAAAAITTTADTGGSYFNQLPPQECVNQDPRSPIVSNSMAPTTGSEFQPSAAEVTTASPSRHELVNFNDSTTRNAGPSSHYDQSFCETKRKHDVVDATIANPLTMEASHKRNSLVTGDGPPVAKKRRIDNPSWRDEKEMVKKAKSADPRIKTMKQMKVNKVYVPCPNKCDRIKEVPDAFLGKVVVTAANKQLVDLNWSTSPTTFRQQHCWRRMRIHLQQCHDIKNERDFPPLFQLRMEKHGNKAKKANGKYDTIERANKKSKRADPSNL